MLFSKTFSDQMIDIAANEEARKFYEEKVRAVIDDPEVAELLIPNDHPIGTKRICTDTNYFQTFNRAHVELVSVRRTPIESDRRDGYQHLGRALRRRCDRAGHRIRRDDRALGQDRHRRSRRAGRCATTGPTARAPISDWVSTDFPNLFLVSGPGAPAVLANMVLHAEAHVNWIADAISYLDEHGHAAIEADRRRRRRTGTPNSTSGPTPRCSRGPTPGTWAPTCLASHGFSCCSSADSLPYLDICNEVANAGYKGFSLLKAP